MEKELFNPNTVKRLCSKIKLTTKQKTAAKEWLYFLDQGRLKGEKINYLKFVAIVLKDLLGYSIRETGFEEGNIEFSYKNKEDKTILGIEAKGTKTKDLFAEQKGYRAGQNTPVEQLWTYMGKLGLHYGIATNYKDFVLIDRSKGLSAYHVIDFEDIKGNEEKLKEFVAIFSREQVIDKGFIEKLEEESIVEEKIFTKEFYKLFHETRLMLLKDFQDNGLSKEDSLHYAQVFMNRLMFIFFAEDTDKLERRIFEQLVGEALKAESLINEHSKLVSDQIVNLFLQLDKGSAAPHKIYAFDGELFRKHVPPRVFFKDIRDKKFFAEIYLHSKLKKEPELDENTQKVFDKYKNKINPIIKNLLVMASFDFQSEVSVNILGHIFEQSLADLEELKEDKPKKRKKEGIFYTPEYITDYICRNTIIPYLSKKDAKTPRELVLEHAKKISELEDKFKNLKILDPACGSGAFLIKAVDVLLEIHKEIQIFKQDEGQYTAVKRGRKKKKDQGQLMLVKWNEEDEARKIIEKNIYGVDINEESVEITKLSLFLKIAKKNRKLIDLSKNIKCGNSLIDDKEVDPERAFVWEKEFPFKFGVVVGNPPYVRVQQLTYKHIDWYKQNYKFAHKRIDISLLFFERAFEILSEGGKGCFISSNQWLKTEYGEKAREFFSGGFFSQIVDLRDKKVFEATTYVSIFEFQKNQVDCLDYYEIDKKVSKIISIEIPHSKLFTHTKIPYDKLSLTTWNLNAYRYESLMKKIKENSDKLSKIGDSAVGCITGSDELLRFNTKQVKEGIIDKELALPLVIAENVRKWVVSEPRYYVFYPYEEEKGETKLLKENILKSKFPKTYRYLQEHKQALGKRKDSRTTMEAKGFWYGLVRFGSYSLFRNPKILTPGECSHNKFSLDESGYAFPCARVFAITSKKINLKALLGILNSSIVEFYLQQITPLKSGNSYNYSANYLRKTPIPKIDRKKEKELENKVGIIIVSCREKAKKKSMFLRRIKQNLSLKVLPRSIEKFYTSDFNVFCENLKKLKIVLNMKQQDEWESYFEEYKKEIIDFQEKIDKTEKEINEIVYDLFGIIDKEKKIIEDNLK